MRTVQSGINMGRVNVVLTDEIEHRLRLAIVQTYGGKKGDLSESIEQAIKEWLERNEQADGKKRGK